MLQSFLIVLCNMLKNDIGLQRHRNLKNSGIQCRFLIWWRSRSNFIFNRVRFLRWITWKCVNGYRNIFWIANWRTWGSLVHGKLQIIQDVKRVTASFFIKTQQKRSPRFWLWRYLSQKQIETTYSVKQEKESSNEFSQNFSFYATQNPHVTKRTRIVLSEALLHCHLAN